MRLVDADALLKCIPYEDVNSRFAVQNAPTIEERKKGKWADFSMSGVGIPIEKCGECGEWSYGMGKNYCPHCGAKNMERGEEE